jgi:hypothetical protein
LEALIRALPACPSFCLSRLLQLPGSVLASTPFIGPTQNNFSHFLWTASKHSVAHRIKLSSFDASDVPKRFIFCLVTDHRLPRCASVYCPGSGQKPCHFKLLSAIPVTFLRSEDTVSPWFCSIRNGGKRVISCRHSSSLHPSLFRIFNPFDYCSAPVPGVAGAAGGASGAACGPSPCEAGGGGILGYCPS